MKSNQRKRNEKIKTVAQPNNKYRYRINFRGISPHRENPRKNPLKKSDPEPFFKFPKSKIVKKKIETYKSKRENPL
jgi:hypothetical protein